MAVCSISVVPVGTGDTSVSSYVAQCQRILEEKDNLKFQLTPMATIIEGDLKNIMDVINELHNAPFESGARRVLTTIIIDDRLDKELTMKGKLESVQEQLQE